MTEYLPERSIWIKVALVIGALLLFAFSMIRRCDREDEQKRRLESIPQQSALVDLALRPPNAVPGELKDNNADDWANRVVRYQVTIDGQAADVVDGRVVFESPPIQLRIKERPKRVFVNSDFSFWYLPGVVVASVDNTVTLAADGSFLRLVGVSTAEAKALAKTVERLAKSRIKSQVLDSSREIGEVSTDGVMVLGADGQRVEVYVHELEANRSLLVELHSPVANRSGVLLEALRTLEIVPDLARPDFDVSDGFGSLGKATLSEPLEAKVGGIDISILVTARDVVEQTVDGVSFSYPRATLVTQIGSAHFRVNAWASILLFPVDFNRDRLMKELNPKGEKLGSKPVETTIAGRPWTGTQYRRGGDNVEIYEQSLPNTTRGILVRYLRSDSKKLQAQLQPILESLRFQE